MIIDLLPIHKFIAVNNMEEVTNPVLFEQGSVPTDKGPLSVEIFGSTMQDRKGKFAYIDLGGPFFHPFIYKSLKRMDVNFEHAVNGTRKFRVSDDGQLIEDEDGKTGINFIYRNWDKLKFKRNQSKMRSDRIDVLEGYKKDTIFVKQWIVIPAFYRDVNLQNTDQGKVSHHEINDLYSRLIRLSGVIRDGNTFDFVLSNTEAFLQNTLVEIYDLLRDGLHKKNGLIRKSLLGKSIDYGSRSVITAPVFQSNHYSEMEVDFYHTGIPMGQVTALFTPFVIAWVKNFFRNELEASYMKYPIFNKKGEVKQYVKLKDPITVFDEEYIKKAIDRFVHAPSDRFEKIELPVDDENYKGKIYLSFAGRSMKSSTDTLPEDTSPLINRPATWTDVIYQALEDIVTDKMVWITRYPLLDYFGMFPNRVRVLSTMKTEPMYIGDKVYPRYPVVDLDLPPEQLSVYFIDTVRMSNLYLAGLGGDFDGDGWEIWSPLVVTPKDKFCERLTSGVGSIAC